MKVYFLDDHKPQPSPRLLLLHKCSFYKVGDMNTLVDIVRNG